MRVGIVVPTLGIRPDWLKEAVGSIESQDADVKLVIVAPPRAVERIREQLPGRSVIAETRSGIVAAIESGWDCLDDCAVLTWLGDDDQLTSNSLEAAVECLLASSGAAMVYGDYEYVDESGRRLVVVRPGRFAPSWLRLGQNFIAQPGCLYRRESVARHGGLSPTLRLAFDVDLHLRLLRDGAVYCARPLARIRTHASSLTVAESEASLIEFREAVWVDRGRTTALARLQPVWTLAGRIYYRFHRTY